MVIGIGGVSNSGKTTLARLLQEYFVGEGYSVSVVHQDDYTISEERIPRIRDRIDWEVPESLDFGVFHSRILSEIPKNNIIIAEGLMTFYNEEIKGLYDVQIFIEISWTTFLKRKRNDVRWGSEIEPRWYMEYIWDSFNKYGNPPYSSSLIKGNGEQRFDVHGMAGEILKNF